MIMQKSVLDPQDQRIPSSMEDSTAMTIEFLRARLLSERSISKSSRQRADELAKKVMNLEEQLRMVTLQRKMAEKATADVLAILENQGISDVSEEFDSGSDLEVPYESGVSNEYAKEGERSVSLKGRRYGSDELFGSHADSSPVSSRSLSWKGRHSSRSLEKYKTSSLRRQNSFSSNSSSPKHRQGKSCRKIRHRQTRSVIEETRDKSVQANLSENEFASSSEGFPNFSDARSKIPVIESKIQEEDESEVSPDIKNHHVAGYGKEKDMEKALEDQAQLIDQYEAMEQAQRDWEEKFRENNSTTPDSCDPENHLDMTEDKDESKAQITGSAKVVTSNAQTEKAGLGDVCLSEEIFKAEARDTMPKSHDDSGGYNYQKSPTSSTSDMLGQESSHSSLKGKQIQSSENCHCQPSNMNHQATPSHRNGYLDSKPTYPFPTNVNGDLHQNDASRNQNDRYALVPHQQSHEFSGILESLKQARISLQQELNRSPPPMEGGYTGKAITPSAFVSKTEDRFDISAGCSGLFRVPSDFSNEASDRFSVHHSTAGFSPNFYIDRGLSRTSDGHFGINPYYATTLSLPAPEQSLATQQYLENGSRFDSQMAAPEQSLVTQQYLENGSRFDSTQPHFDPVSIGGPFSSSKFMYPTFPINPSYPSAKSSQIAFGDELSRPYSFSSRTVGDPLAYRFSSPGDHLR